MGLDVAQSIDEGAKSTAITRNNDVTARPAVLSFGLTDREETSSWSGAEYSTNVGYTKNFVIDKAASLLRDARMTETPYVSSNTSAIQIWEGHVVDINENGKSMRVTLNAKIGQIPDHVADIYLEWVSPQDRDLIRPGAVFYLTLFKRLRRGTVENSQELRFRRFPAWSAQQIAKIYEDADALASKFCNSTTECD